MPDTEQLLIFITQVLVPPLQLIETFLGAFLLFLFILSKFKEIFS